MASYVLIGTRCLLATVFGLACLGKARSASRFRQFATTIERMTKLPERTAMLLASAIVVCEGTTAVLLAVPLAPPVATTGFVLATGLLAVFVAVVVRAVRGGVLTECRCFGRSGSLMSKAMIVRNLLLMAFAVPGLAMRPATPATDLLGLALALIAGAAVAVFFTRYYDEVVRAILRRRSAANTHEPAREPAPTPM